MNAVTAAAFRARKSASAVPKAETQEKSQPGGIVEARVVSFFGIGMLAIAFIVGMAMLVDKISGR